MWVLIESHPTRGLNVIMVSNRKVDVEYKLSVLSRNCDEYGVLYHIRQAQEYNIVLKG